jgi:hypothetical protein
MYGSRALTHAFFSFGSSELRRGQLGRDWLESAVGPDSDIAPKDNISLLGPRGQSVFGAISRADGRGFAC